MDAPKVIVVEDDENMQWMLRRYLEKAGYDVRAASSVATGRVLGESEPWEIAILDRGLPDGDGLDLCRELRSTHPHAYIVMLTGASSRPETLEGFASGADDYIAKPAQMDELLARIRAGARIVELQRKLLESNRRLEELSLTDPLTSLRNRRAFEDELAQSFEHARRYERALSLAIIDLDHFKPINDRFGHPAGDAVLRAVAQLLDGTTRQSDFVARIGGEEFAVLLPETPLFDALQFGEKVRANIASATIRTGEVEHHVTVSIGVACTAHSRINSAQELFEAADQALYRAKESGRNRVEVERRKVRRSEEQPIASSRLGH